MRIAQRIWNELIAPNLEKDVSCPKFFYMEDYEFTEFLEQDYFYKWFDKNMIYCEDTHSFVHRLFDHIKSGECKTHRDAQHKSFDIIKDMRKEYEAVKK